MLRKIGSDLFQRVIVSKKSTLVGLAIVAADVIIQNLVASSNPTIHTIAGIAASLLVLYKGSAQPAT